MLTIDDLTGIANRRYLDFYLSNIRIENEEFDVPFGILFFDIDFFKKVNDTHGHIIGDEILKLVSKTVQASLRNDDKIGRWGGEEFIAVIKVDNNEELLRIAEKLKLLVSQSFYEMEDKSKLSVTVSIGGTLFEKGETIEELIARADANMYNSKDSGRNKVTIK